MSVSMAWLCHLRQKPYSGVVIVRGGGGGGGGVGGGEHNKSMTMNTDHVDHEH